MSKTIYYRQCRLSKTTETGLCQQVSWIPEKYAVAGKQLKLRDDDDVWEDGWKVVGAGNRLAEHLLPDYHKEIKQHRKATGDSLPKV